MRKVFWDTMLLIYILEGNTSWQKRVIEILAASKARQDRLFTSCLALGEVMAGAAGRHNHAIREALNEMGFQFLIFDEAAVQPFGQLRSMHKVPVADSIHLACAAAEGMDLFLTGDKALTKLYVPGIKFISDFNNPIL